MLAHEPRATQGVLLLRSLHRLYDKVIWDRPVARLAFSVKIVRLCLYMAMLRALHAMVPRYEMP